MSPRDRADGDPLALAREVDRLGDRFESAWQGGERPSLAAWLPADGRLRGAALVELACIDLEWRLRGNEPVHVESYLASFPELRADPDGVLRLIALEVQLRRSREPDLTGEEFARRFPDLAALPGWEAAVPAADRREQSAESASQGDTTVDAFAGAGEREREERDRLGLHEEIGRGGMGVVIRGRDDGLGRDVAVKVLHEKYAGKPEMARRLLEEARVTGQLQHPAIVPVHDIGKLPDGRPYFTMKLIRGRTLIELLNERSDPGQDRPRFLKVFEQVCQALAYAHSKGVVHRDLKPHNVMVGAFGEVQVMDWGLAKVLPSGGRQPPEDQEAASVIRKGNDEGSGSETEEGAVMGTAAYMAPEQARGEVQDIDARSDVFGLGAMLCQILTGQPAFPAPAKEAMRRARAGDLADAFARLDGCGADAELIDLAKRCLAAEQVNRPADAGVLAAELTAHLESLEAKLRQEVSDRAAALQFAVNLAMAEQKRRKLQLVLITVLGVALLLFLLLLQAEVIPRLFGYTSAGVLLYLLVQLLFTATGSISADDLE
jgi:hypothetical protein